MERLGDADRIEAGVRKAGGFRLLNGVFNALAWDCIRDLFGTRVRRVDGIEMASK